MINCNPSDFLSKPRETDDGSIDLVSTSNQTADASPIILNSTDLVQTKFVPVVVDNHKDTKKSVRGSLIHAKKRKSDTEFPTEKLTRKSVKIGESIEISLDTSETYRLFEGLQNLYELHNQIGTIPSCGATYTKIDSTFRQFQAIISNDPSAARMLGQSENFELVKMLLQLITQSESLDSLKNGLKELCEANMSSLSVVANITRLEQALVTLDENMNNDNEEEWHNIFKANQWILSQVFSCPYTIFDDKAYVGGKGLDNKRGNICDFLYQNKLTQNVALIEIKTPCTKLLGKQYRGTFSLSADMSGAVNQILNYKDSLTKNFYNLQNTSSVFEAFNPKCCVIIGKRKDLTQDQVNTFENYRNSLSNVTIIAFDELRTRIYDMLQLFNPESSPQESEAVDFDSDDVPF